MAETQMVSNNGVNRPVLANGVKLMAEVLMPGASQILAGKVGRGLASNLGAGAATLALAATGAPLLGALVVLGIRMDSLSKSILDQSLFQMIDENFDKKSSEGGEPAAPSAVVVKDTSTRSTRTPS
jgi:hypothetical protein